MSLTPAEQAEYEQLVSQYGPAPTAAPATPTVESGGILSRIGQQAANLPSNIAEGMVQANQGLLNMALPAHKELAPVVVPKPYDIATAQTIGEKVVDFGSQAAAIIPQFIAPQMAATKGLQAAGLSQRAASVGGGVLGWGAAAGEQGGVSVGANAAMGGMEAIADMLPRRERLLLSGLTGLASAVDMQHQTTPASAMETGAWSLVNAGLIFLSPQMKALQGQEAIRQAASATLDNAKPAPTGSPGTTTLSDQHQTQKRASHTPDLPIIGKPGVMPAWLQGPTAYEPQASILFDPNAPAAPVDHVLRPDVRPGSIGLLGLESPYPETNGFRMDLPAEMQNRVLEKQGNFTNRRGMGEGLPPMLAPIQMDIPLNRRIVDGPIPTEIATLQKPGPGREFFPELVPERYRGGIQKAEVAPLQTPENIKGVHYSRTPFEPSTTTDLSKIPGRYEEESIFGPGMYAMEHADEASWKGASRFSLGKHRNEIELNAERPLVITPATMQSMSVQDVQKAAKNADAVIVRGFDQFESKLKAVDARVGTLSGTEKAAAYDAVSKEIFGLPWNKVHEFSRAGLTTNQVFAPQRSADKIKVATLQKEPLHPQSLFPSGLQTMLKDAPGWTGPGENLKAGFTLDAFEFAKRAKTSKDVERMYKAADKLEAEANKLFEAETLEGVIQASEYVSKVQYLREAAQFAEGFPAKLDQFLERDPAYIPPVPSQAYTEALASRAVQTPQGTVRTPEVGSEQIIYSETGDPTEVMVTGVTKDGAVHYEQIDYVTGEFSEKVATLQEFERLTKEPVTNYAEPELPPEVKFTPKNEATTPPATPVTAAAATEAPRTPQVKEGGVKVHDGSKWVEGKIVGNEDGVYEVLINDPIRGERSVFTTEVRTTGAGPATPKGGIPFQDVPGAKTMMDRADERFFARDRIEIDYTGRVEEPRLQTVEQAMRDLSPEASVLMRAVIARLQMAVGRSLKLKVSNALQGSEARAMIETGETYLNQSYLKSTLSNWDRMSQGARDHAIIRVSSTIGHEIAHIATRYGEKTGLTYNGKRLTNAVEDIVHSIPKAGREYIIRQLQKNRGASQVPDVVNSYLAGDIDAVYAHYSKKVPSLTREHASRLAAEEFMVELGAVELHKRMDTTGLPASLRDAINIFKQTLVNVMEWFRGTRNFATLQELSGITGKILDHYKAGNNSPIALPFAGRNASHPHTSLQFRSMPSATPSAATPFVKEQLLKLGVRSVAGAAIGGAGSTLSDGEISMIEGMLAGGVMGAFGPAMIKHIVKGSTPGGFREAMIASKGNPLKAYERIMNGKAFKDRVRELGAEGRFDTGSGLAKFARFMEAEFAVNLDPRLKGAVEHARGLAAEQAQIIQDALDKSRFYQPPESLNFAALQYLEGQITRGDFTRKLSTDEEKAFGSLMITAREGMTRLSKMFADGMPDSKFRAMVIKNADNYLGRFYKAFHTGEFDMDKFDAAKKDLMKQLGHTPEVADSIMREYMREVQANRSVFRRRANAGQKIDSSLHRRRLVTEAEIDEQRLKVEDIELTDPLNPSLKAEQQRLTWMEGHQITDNWRAWLGEYTGAKERALLTFAKLHPTSISAKVYDILDNSQDSFGLKFAYGAEELSKTLEKTKAAMTMNPPADEFATLQKQLQELEAFVPLPSGAAYGKLSGKFVNRFVRDEIATYSTPFQFMEQPILRGISSFNNLVKVSRTALNPITVIRNYLQMPVFGLIAKTNVADVLAAKKEIHKTKGELYKLMLREGITTSDFVAGELTKGPGWMFSGYADSDIATRVAKYGYEKALDLYRQPDMLIRAGAFISARKRFASRLFGTPTPTADMLNDPRVIEKARNFTDRYTMNYDTVPRIVKLGRQLPFVSLFISYTAEITRILKNLAEDAINPHADSAGRMHAIGVLSAMAALPAIIEATATSGLSDKDKQDWEKLKKLSPDYSRSRFQMPYKRDEKGRFHYFDITNMMPADSYAQMIKSAVAGDFEAVAAANPIASLQNTPLLNMAVEQITGEDLHTGKPIHGASRVTEVLKEVLPPVLPPGFEGERLQKAFSRNAEGTLGTENLKTGVVVKPSDIVANYLTGMRFANVQLSTVQQRYIGKTKREIAEHQAILRDTLRTNARPEVKQQAQENYRRSVQEIMLQMHQKLAIEPMRKE